MAVERDLIVQALPNYEIGDEVGRGAWGVVLTARHRQLGRTVAVKQLPRAFGADPSVQRRFVSEARVLASLDHPHIVPVFDYVELEGLCLLVMELLSGGTVWSRLTTDGFSAEEACGIVLATCTALQHAHQLGILHRDVKPANLLFTAPGVVKVSDFGLAKVLGENQTLATRTGEVLGTPAYMAPEQVLGNELTSATDTYALGVVSYEMLSGGLPFLDDGNAMAVLYRHVHDQPRPLTDAAPSVSGPVADVIMRALATEPDDRYASAEDYGLALADTCNDAWEPGWARRSGVAVMAPGAIADRLSGGRPAPVPPASAEQVRPAPPTVVERVRSSPGARAGSATADEFGPDEVVALGDLTEPGPPAGGSGRRGLLLAGVALAGLAAVAAALAVLLGDGGSNGGDGGGERPVATGAEPTATTRSPPTDVRSAADDLVDAWQAGDRDAALRVADPGAVDELFAVPLSDLEPEFDSCIETGTAQLDCSYGYGDGTIVVRVDTSGGAYRVVEAGPPH